MQPVPDYWSSTREPYQIPRVVWLCIAGALDGLDHTILGHHAFVLIRKERIALPGIATRLRRRHDDAGRCLLVLRLVVLRDHPEFLDRVAWEEVAATAILTYDPAP